MLSLQASPAKAQSYSTQQGSAGCSSAHCTPLLNDSANTPPPAASGSLSIKSSDLGSSAGLGCSSNLTNIAACTFTYDNSDATQSGLRAYDGNGNKVLDSSTGITTLDSNAEYSAPIVFADGSILAADDSRLIYFPYNSPNGMSSYSTLWKIADKANGDKGNPVSPVLVTNTSGNTIVFVATKCQGKSLTQAPSSSFDPCPISTFKLSASGTSASLSRVSTIALTDGTNYYETFNTPVVDQAHSRVYVQASQICYPVSSCPTFLTPRQGRLFAIDINTANPSSSSYGAMTISSSWFLNFPGPSGASPLLIPNITSPITGRTGNGLFFDGLAYSGSNTGNSNCASTYSGASGTNSPTLDLNTADSYYGCFYGVLDSSFQTTNASATAEVMWYRPFKSQFFEANAAADPVNGGLWIFPIQLTGGYGNGPTCNQLGQYVANNPTPPNCLIRISTTTGYAASGSSNNQLQGPLDLGTLLGKGINCGDNTNGCTLQGVAAGNAGAYAPSSAVTVTSSGSSVYLTLGATSNATGAPPYVTTINVSTVNSESIYWSAPLPDTAQGQFAFVTGTSGVSADFTGKSFGPAYFGP